MQCLPIGIAVADETLVLCRPVGAHDHLLGPVLHLHRGAVSIGWNGRARGMVSGIP